MVSLYPIVKTPRGNYGFRGEALHRGEPHGVDIPFFMFFCNFFAACTD